AGQGTNPDSALAKYIRCFGGAGRLFDRLDETTQRHPAHRKFGIQSGQNELSLFCGDLSRLPVSEDDLNVVSARREFHILPEKDVVLLNGLVLFGGQGDIKPAAEPGDNFSRRFADHSDYVELDNLLVAFMVELDRARRDFERQGDDVGLSSEASSSEASPLPRRGRIKFTQDRQKAALLDKNSIGGDLIRT